MSNKEIAQALNISAKTIENHLTRVYEKIGCNGRAPAALFALENAIFEF
jgi:DNA-binding NarL/FixJ family response regulator